MLALVGGQQMLAQDLNANAPTSLAAAPDRFFQVQDDSGFLWQALDNGALLAGDTQYLQSGLNLIVNGEPFAPKESTTREPEAGAERIGLTLSEKRAGSDITRDIWYDIKRSGARIWDTISNTSKEDRQFTVVLRTTYPFAWQSLHGTGGSVLDSGGGAALQPDDVSLGIHFSPSDGRHDTFLIFGSENGGQRPELKVSANSRELLLSYQFTIPAGQKRGLVHWILQRNLPDLTQDAAMLVPFVQRGQWISAGVDMTQAGNLINLPPDALPAQTQAVTQLQGLVVLNELTDQLGLYRRSEDMLWLGPSNGISGVLDTKGSITLAGVETIDLPITDIAAVRGGTETGLPTRVFLRDGRVFSGTVTKGALSWTTKGAPTAEQLEIGDIYFLLLAADDRDGEAPKGTTHFVELVDGRVLAFASATEKTPAWTSAFGRESTTWENFVEFDRFGGTAALAKVLLKDGSFFPVTLAETRLTGTDVGAKRALETSSALVERMWRVGAVPTLKSALSMEWIDFSEIPETFLVSSGMLLVGNQILAGTLEEKVLTVRDGTASLAVDSRRVESFVRSADPETPNRWEIALTGGEKISGEIVDDSVGLVRSGGTVQIPMSDLLSYRKVATP